MESRISIIKWFLVITLVCVGGVEIFYQGFEYFVLKSPKIETKVQTKQETVVNAGPTEQTEEAQKPDYRIILQRNLFASYKRDTEPKTEDAPQEETAELATELNLVLMGTVSGTENSRRAIILNKQTREQEIYSAGEVIEGALIEEIKRGEILLTIDGQRKRLDMSEAAEMRPAYKPPPSQAASNANLNDGTGQVRPAAATTSRTPRIRVVRRPPARRAKPATTQ